MDKIRTRSLQVLEPDQEKAACCPAANFLPRLGSSGADLNSSFTVAGAGRPEQVCGGPYLMKKLSRLAQELCVTGQTNQCRLTWASQLMERFEFHTN